MEKQDEVQKSEAPERTGGTWSETGTSVLKYNLRLLLVTGQWPLVRMKAYRGYTTFSMSASAVAIAMNIAGAAWIPNDMEQMTSALGTILPMLAGFFYGLLLLRYGPEVGELVNRIDQLLNHQRWFCQQDERSAAILKEAHRKTLKITVAFSCYLFTIAGYWIVGAFLVGDGRLPFVQLPYLTNPDPVAFRFIFLMHSYTTPYCNYTTLCVEFLFLGVMLHLSAQFKILSLRLATLGQHFGKDTTSKRAFWSTEGAEAVYDELCLCIKTHQKLLTFVKFLDDVMSPFAMSQFISGTLDVCVILFQATHHPDAITYLKWGVWLPGPGTKLYIYCWAAHEVAQEMVNAAYSYYALLSQMND